MTRNERRLIFRFGLFAMQWMLANSRSVDTAIQRAGRKLEQDLFEAAEAELKVKD